MRGYWQYTEVSTFWKNEDKLWRSHLTVLTARDKHIPKKYIAMQYKWRKGPLSSILKTTSPHQSELRVIKLLKLDPNAYIPTPEEYAATMSECMHHRPRQHQPVVKPASPPAQKKIQPPLTKREKAQLKRLISVISKPTNSPTDQVANPRLDAKLPITTPISVPKPVAVVRRESISSSDDSIILTMQIDVPVEPAAKSPIVANNPSVIYNPPTVIKPYSAVKSSPKMQPFSRSEPKVVVPQGAASSRASPKSKPKVVGAEPLSNNVTVLEWSARMRRYQQEEIEHLGLDVIRSNSLHAKTPAVASQDTRPKLRRGSPKLDSRVSSRDSLSKLRIEEWLDALSPVSATVEPYTVGESADVLDLNAMASADLNLNICRACGEKCDKKCRCSDVQTETAGLLIDI